MQIWRLRGKGMLASKILLSKDQVFSTPLQNIYTYCETYGEGDEYNLFYTIGQQKELNNRQMEYKEYLAYDIDNIGTIDPMDIAKAVSNITNTDLDKVALVSSGHGLHYIIKLDYKITVEDNANLAAAYKASCKQITSHLHELKLLPDDGKCDPAIWDISRVLRLPSSINRKEGRPDVTCKLLQANPEPQNYNLNAFIAKGLTAPKQNKSGPEAPYSGPPYTPDKDLILTACPFMANELKTGGQGSDEPRWRAALSIAAHIDQALGDTNYTT